MNLATNIILLGILSFVFGLIIIPFVRKIAIKFNLVDKPNYRKVHTNPIPLVGGISIAILFFIMLFLSGNFIAIFEKYLPILASAYILLIVGVIDDKTDLSAKYKLVIQLILATIVALSGTRITSFYGFLGIEDITIYWQYILTIIVITGVVNAFNLMDGVDGLVGGLSFLGFTMFLIASIFYNDMELLTLSVLFMGILLSFLRFNLSRKQKIFMGDSGSLFLGFIFVSLGIHLLESQQINQQNNYAYAFLLLVSFFAIPVLDSMRVYVGRMKKGDSPFKADKSHLHHLLLSVGLTHKKISLYVVLMCMTLFFVGFGLISYLSTTLIVLALITLFSLVVKTLLMINDLNYWKKIIREMEQG